MGLRICILTNSWAMLILLVQGPTLGTTALDDTVKVGVSETVFSALPPPHTPILQPRKQAQRRQGTNPRGS